MDIELESGLTWLVLTQTSYEAFHAAIEAIAPNHNYPVWQELGVEDRIAFEAAVRSVEEQIKGADTDSLHWTKFAQTRAKKSKP